MGAIPNTIRRNGIFYFRRRVPDRLRPLLGRPYICLSLRTHRFEVAQRISRALYLKTEELFAIPEELHLSDEDIANLVQDMFRSHIEADNQARIERGRPFDPALIAEQREKFASMARDARRALGENDLNSAAFKAVEIVHNHNLSGKLTELDIRRLQQAILRAAPDLYAALDARYRGDFNYEPTDALLKAEAVPKRAHQQASEAPATANDGQEGTISASLSKRAEEFREDQVRRGIWSQHYGNQARNTFRLFIEACGDLPLRAYTREDARRFKELLSDLPSSYGKDSSFQGRTIAEIVALTKKQSVRRLSATTVARHLNTLAQLWSAAVEAKEATEPIFSGWKQSKRRKANEPRRDWSRDKLKALFASPVWTGCKSADRRAEPGSEIIRDERFWIPLIAVHSGMRLEEICQLELADLRKEDGHWVFDINRANGKHVKNPSSVRTVPVHPELIKIGLIRLYSELHARGETRLFPQLGRAASGKYGTNFTKWFGHYRKAIDLYEPKLDFHSFRHTTATLLRWADVPKPTIARILGHTETGETGNYGSALQIGQLKAALEQIDTGLDLKHLHVMPPASQS